MPPQTDLKRQYPCRCGAAHPQMTRLAGTPVLQCPDYDGDLDLFTDKFGVPFLVKGTGMRYAQLANWQIANDGHVSEMFTHWGGRMDTLAQRLDALEAKKKEGR